jgi:S1-C subfamily serine protease
MKRIAADASKQLNNQDAGSGVPGRLILGVVALAIVLGTLAAPRQASAQDMSPGVEEHLRKSAVFVWTALSEKERGDRKLGSGSGYFINTTGLAITNNHVVDPTHRQSEREKQAFHYNAGKLTWTVIVDAGTEDEKEYYADVLYQDEWADQAVIQVFDEDGELYKSPHYLRFLPETRLVPRMRVFACGFPGGTSQKTAGKEYPEATITDGNVTSMPRTPGGRVRMIYTDCEARPGNSGGPMVDRDGFLVGTVTLMTREEDRKATAGGNWSALVPAKLTRQMVRNTFLLGKIHEQTDYAPFVAMMTDDEGRINVPEYDRKREWDVVYYPDGDRIYGKITTDEITWESPMGAVKVPTDVIAYVLSSDNGAELFLEGGNRLFASDLPSEFSFEPDGGEKVTQYFDDVRTVGFRTSDRRVKPAAGRLTVLDCNAGQLIMSTVEGQPRFQTKVGTLNVKLEDILRLDQDEDGDQVLSLRDGRRLTGRFSDEPLKGTIAATGTPIEFRLNNLKFAIVEELKRGLTDVAGLDLEGVMARADRDVLQLTNVVESQEPGKALPKIEKVMEDKDFRRIPKEKQRQYYLLKGVAELRTEKYDDASKSLRKASSSDQLNVRSYAEACMEVLKEYENSFEGNPLSDRRTFAEAGMALAQNWIRDARNFLKDAKYFKWERKADYRKAIAGVRKHEEQLLVAGVLGGVEADDELIRLWNLAVEAGQGEWQRLDREEQEQGNDGRPRNAARARREQEERAEYREEINETLREYYIKMRDYGFRIEDPDIQEQRDRGFDDDDDNPDGP